MKINIKILDFLLYIIIKIDNKMFRVLAISIALMTSVTAKISNGTCATPTLQPDFNPTKYLGIWFQVAKDLNSPSENGNCAQSRYSLNTNGSLAVANSQFINETGEVQRTPATAVCDGPHCNIWF